MIRERVRAFVREYGMLKPGDKVIAGLSGGPDSLCLFYLLLELCREEGAALCAVHVHHGLRGEEADRDEAFVRELCEREDVPLRVFHFDVQRRAREEGRSLEEAGRLCRYEAFRQEAKRLGGARIAVAHHRDDQAETVFFHLIRGSGIRGLGGMEPVRGEIIRPLLCLEREEILAWLLAEGHRDWCVDSSNESGVYARNRIRREILPIAEEINPRARRHIGESAQELLEIERYLERQTQAACRICVREEEGGCFLFQAAYERLDPLIQGRLFRLCLSRHGGLRDIERVHIGLLRELMEKQSGRSLDLPGGRRALREGKGLRLLERGSKQEEREEPGSGICPMIPGICRAGEHIFQFTVEAAQKNQIIPEKTYTKWFDYDKIKQSLEIRRRRAGDYLEINQAHGRKKLKAYLVDEKIPASERERLWLLADGAHILWVPGHRISEGYKVTAETARILKVQMDGGEENG